jgi:hypothetical protein
MQQIQNEKQGTQKGRTPFYYKDNLVYEWEQTLEEVYVYIKAPECLQEKYKSEIRKNLQPGQQMPKLQVQFDTTHLKVGLIGFPPYLDVSILPLTSIRKIYQIKLKSRNVCGK